MSLVEWHLEETTAVVIMNNGENRHNLEFAGAMKDVLAAVLAVPSVDGLILTSADPKVWSLGIDLNWLAAQQAAGNFQTIKDFLYGMNRVFTTLLTYPMPVVAALNGHVAANGLVLACCCDFRFMRADKGFARFPEIDVGIPFLPGMVALTRQVMPHALVAEMQYSGRRFTAQELEQTGFVKKACDGEGAALAAAREFMLNFRKKRGIFGAIKNALNNDVVRVMTEEDADYIEKLKLMVTD